jgi:dolichol-phosphate mannosyltransferase
MKLSVVIPCYNESDSIAHMYEQLSAVRAELDRRGPFELVLVDDGSTDDTYAQLSAAFAAWDNVRIVQHERNRGLGAALTAM